MKLHSVSKIIHRVIFAPKFFVAFLLMSPSPRYSEVVIFNINSVAGALPCACLVVVRATPVYHVDY